ncbi:MAG: histidine kinase [Lachnospiraceae bacterium]|nr:histidine kinase [Lachnospiraceae bacterium]
MGEYKRSRTLKQYLLTMGIMLSGVLLGSLLLFGFMLFRQYRTAYEKEYELLTTGYAQELSKDIQAIENYVKNQYSGNVHYQKLKQKQLTESEWILATYYLENSFIGEVEHLDYFGGVFYYDLDLHSLRSSYTNQTDVDVYELNLKLKDILQVKVPIHGIMKDVLTVGEDIYLLYVIGDTGDYLGYVLKLSGYYNVPEDSQVIILGKDGQVLLKQGNEIITDERMELMLEGSTFTWRMIYIVSRKFIENTDLELIFALKDENLVFWNTPEFWLVFILVPLLALVLIWHLGRLINRIMYQPIEHFLDRLEEFRQPEGTEAAEDTDAENAVTRSEVIKGITKAGKKKGTTKTVINRTELEEIRRINERMDELIVEMQTLEQEKYAREKEANAALLQYYQLQVRPHFFLNCLNIIDSLMKDGDVETVNQMIFAVSRHFRYVFQDSDSLVTIGEELEEVVSYCNIYQIRYQKPVLLQKQVEEAYENFRVPILCLQTFTENSVKYAASSERVLSISIKVHEVDVDGVRFLRIYYCDNGEGYPQERLDELNKPVKEFQYNSRQVGIDNLKYRLYLLFGENVKLFFYNNVAGGAATELLLPMDVNYERIDH